MILVVVIIGLRFYCCFFCYGKTKFSPKINVVDFHAFYSKLIVLNISDGSIKGLKIKDKYQPDSHDKTTYLLQSAHVDEGDYFSSRVHKDIDAIMDDLRKAHKGRSG